MIGEGEGKGGRGWTHNVCTNVSHLQCMVEVAICGVLDADGGHSSTAEGSGLRNEPGVVFKTTHSRSYTKWLDTLAEDEERVGKRREGGWEGQRDGWKEGSEREVQREGRNFWHIELTFT